MGFIVAFIIAVVILGLITMAVDSNRTAKNQDFEDSMKDIEISKRTYTENRSIGMLYDEKKQKARIIYYAKKHYKDVECAELGEILVFSSAIVFCDKKANNIIVASITGGNGKDEELKISKVDNFSADKFVWNKMGFSSNGVMNLCSGACIAIDNSNKKVLVVNNVDNPAERRILSFSDIISVEIVENGTTTFSKSTTRTIGGALVGNVLMGGAGAVVGGLSGNAKKADKVDSIAVKILVRSVEEPIMVINVHKGSGLDTSKDDYKKYNDFANEIKDVISVIIDAEDKGEANARVEQPASTNITEELMKIAKLKEDGLLTEEEFSKMKSKLLG